eukprot:m.204177 g.204177  ORF g.204177 m.204177 type:complete len:368 (+) comp39642_c0_seq2:45-1148(+)
MKLIVLFSVFLSVLGLPLTLHHIEDHAAVCNDGSPSGYYLRKSASKSSKWIVFLEGGWYCFDEQSCDERLRLTPQLMSSEKWPLSYDGEGILSDKQEENPNWYDANAVMVGYCSSDHWTGNATANTSSENPAAKWNFLGTKIVNATIQQLLPLGLQQASLLIFTGVSAGGYGSFTNLDRVAATMSQAAPSTHVVGLVDSGWLMNSTQYRTSECKIYTTCPVYTAFPKGVKLWNSLLPDTCHMRFTESAWLCLLAKHVYPAKTPALILEFQYDLADLSLCNVKNPYDEQAEHYVEDIGGLYREELSVVTSLFSPGCLDHTLTGKSSWRNIKINGTSISDAFENFLMGKKKRLSDVCTTPNCNPTCPKS